MKNCEFCKSKLDNNNRESYLQALREIDGLKSQVKLIKQENLSLKNGTSAGKMLDFRKKFKKLCREHGVKMSYDSMNKRLRFSYKGIGIKLYRRVDIRFSTLSW